jgi:hypothetical protein
MKTKGTLRITRDECRLFLSLLEEIETNKIHESIAFDIAGLSKMDYFSAMTNFRNKLKDYSADDRRNSERCISNNFDDLMARLTKKYNK